MRELIVSVDDKPVFSIVPPEEGHKRRDVPISIASGLASSTNSVTISAALDDGISDFVYAILLTQPCDVPYLSKQVLRCGHKEARARVHTLVTEQAAEAQGSDDIVCLTRNKLKLVCPISFERVQAPVRGMDCKHLQCFGLSAYLTSNRQMKAFNNRWQCPFCTLVLRPTDLRFDAYVEQVLKQAPPDVEEVVVSSDGSWKHQNPSSSAAEEAAPSKGAVLDDDLVLDSQDDFSLPEMDGDRNHCASTCLGVTSADVLDIANVHRGSNHAGNPVQNSAAGAASVESGVINMDVDDSPPRSLASNALLGKATAALSDSPIFETSPASEEMSCRHDGASEIATARADGARSRKWRDLSRALRRPTDSAMRPFARSKEARAGATGALEDPDTHVEEGPSAALKRQASAVATTNGKRGRVASQAGASACSAEQDGEASAGSVVELDLSD